MSTQSQRGRQVKRRRTSTSNLRTFYIIIAVVVVVGIVLLITLVTRNNAATANVAAPNAPVGITEDGFYYKGNPDAPLKVTEYADYQCPACRNFATNIAPTIDEKYVETGQVQFIYHEFPLPQHQNAVPAAEAARCAGDQDAYWQMHDLIFQNQPSWSGSASAVNTFNGYAGDLGLNSSEFEACMSEGRHTEQVTQARQSAGAAQIQQTPTFVLNGQQLDASQLVPAIEAALRTGSSK